MPHYRVYAYTQTLTTNDRGRMMKLVEILARELKEWPAGQVYATQDPDREVRFRDCQFDFYASVLADDAGDDFGEGNQVTRAEWKAELARLHSDLSAKPAKKPNKDGWIRHRGGKCPVEAGVLIDVKHRDSCVYLGVPAGEWMAANWGHSKHPEDIMRYRLHNQVEQTVKPGFEIKLPENHEGILSDSSCPIQWRDRIKEIDATVEALEEERASLVQRLEAEGFRLIERAVPPVEDMSDPKNWKVGDVFVQIAGGSWNHSDGTLWTMTNDDGTDMRNYRSDSGSDKYVKDFALKFHSRPSA